MLSYVDMICVGEVSFVFHFLSPQLQPIQIHCRIQSHQRGSTRLLVDRTFSVQTDYVDVIQDEIDTALHAAGDRERPEELRKTLTTVSRKVDSEVTTSDGSVFFCT